MPSLIDHVHQAKHNTACADKFLNQCNCQDWAITAAFYAALHYVEAGFTTINHIGHCMGHREREEHLRREFNSCYKSYRKLSMACHTSRYLNPHHPGVAINFYSQSDVAKLVNDDLTTVRDQVQKAAGVNLR